MGGWEKRERESLTPTLWRGDSMSLKGLSAHCLTGFEAVPPILKMLGCWKGEIE